MEAVQGDADHDHGRQVETERSHHLDNLAAKLTRVPGHGDTPDDFGCDREPDDDQVSHGQVPDQVVHLASMRLLLLLLLLRLALLTLVLLLLTMVLMLAAASDAQTEAARGAVRAAADVHLPQDEEIAKGSNDPAEDVDDRFHHDLLPQLVNQCIQGHVTDGRLDDRL